MASARIKPRRITGVCKPQVEEKSPGDFSEDAKAETG